jgi:hypothetical protein
VSTAQAKYGGDRRGYTGDMKMRETSRKKQRRKNI